jgi:hypothetical protein
MTDLRPTGNLTQSVLDSAHMLAESDTASHKPRVSSLSNPFLAAKSDWLQTTFVDLAGRLHLAGWRNLLAC